MSPAPRRSRYLRRVPNQNTGTGFGRVAADDLDVLNSREQLSLAWTAYPAATGMATKDIGSLASIRSHYVAADSFLQGAIGRARGRRP